MGVERTLTKFKIDISHQEMDRIMLELEALSATAQEAGGHWVSIEAAANWLLHELGYEDIDEFEDALHGTFQQFLEELPTFEVGKDDKGRPVFKSRPEPPPAELKPFRMELKVTDRNDLWNVLLKSKDARLEIPEMEFEISEDSKRKIDSLYNHIAAAIFNLSCHVASVPMSEDHKNKITDCIAELNELLDVEKPFTIIIHDPSGLSEFKDMDKVVTTYPAANEAGAAAGPGPQ